MSFFILVKEKAIIKTITCNNKKVLRNTTSIGYLQQNRIHLYK